MQSGIQFGAPSPALSSTASAFSRAVASSNEAATPPLTPRSLQLRLREAAERVNGVLRDTSDAHSCLAAQDARLSPLNGILETGAGNAGFSGQAERLRQHVSDLRSQLDKGGSKEPTTVHHVQRMLSLLSGYATSVEDPDPAARRELVESIASLQGEVAQLNDLAARGERAAGEVVEVRRTLEDLQVDVNSQIGTPRTPTRVKVSSPGQQQELHDLRQDLTGAIEGIREQVSDLVRSGSSQHSGFDTACVQELRGAVADVRTQISELTAGLAEVRVRSTIGAGTNKTAVEEPQGVSDMLADIAQVKRDLCKSDREMHRRLKELQSEFANLKDEATQLATSTHRDVAELRQRLTATPARAVSPRGGLPSPRTEALGHEGETLIVLKQLIRNSQRETNDAMDELRGQVQQVTSCSSEVALQVAASTKDSANLRKELASLAQDLRFTGRQPSQEADANLVTLQQLQETAEALRVELTSERALTVNTPENSVTHEQLEASIENMRDELKQGLFSLKDDYVASMKQSVACEGESRVALQEELRKQYNSLRQELGTALKQVVEQSAQTSGNAGGGNADGNAVADLGAVKKDIKRLFSQVEILKDHINDAENEAHSSAQGRSVGSTADAQARAELAECRKDVSRLWKQVDILKTALDERADALQEEVLASILEQLGGDTKACSPQRSQSVGGSDAGAAEPEFASIREGLNSLKRNACEPNSREPNARTPAVVIHRPV